MRNLYTLDAYRLYSPWVLQQLGTFGDDKNGAFQVRSKIDSGTLRVIASAGLGWDHVSVSREKRCPTWIEMEQVKRLFFEPHETCMQLHVPESDHINCHPYTLHIWRPHNQPIPVPPQELV